MNIKILIIIFSLTASAKLSSQWFWQNPKPQANTLVSLTLVNETTGFAVGNNGALIKTTDAGETWINIDIPDKYFTDVFFVNENTGYLTEAFGLVFKTTNSGNTWFEVSSAGPAVLRSVYFL